MFTVFDFLKIGHCEFILTPFANIVLQNNAAKNNFCDKDARTLSQGCSFKIPVVVITFEAFEKSVEETTEKMSETVAQQCENSDGQNTNSEESKNDAYNFTEQKDEKLKINSKESSSESMNY